MAAGWLDASTTGCFLFRSSPEFVEPETEELTVSGNLSVTTDIVGVGTSAGATPFTSGGAESSCSSGLTSGSGGGGLGGFGSSRDG